MAEKIKIAVLGASGAVGRELLKAIARHDFISEVSVIVRKAS